jgi:hypothetical protein
MLVNAPAMERNGALAATKSGVENRSCDARTTISAKELL